MAKAFTSVGTLEGKKVRMVYRNDSDVTKRGVIQVTPILGDMTEDERAFHFSSSLLSDSLIFPDAEVKVGDSWDVEGNNFVGLMDPTMLAYANGAITVQRGKDQLVSGRSGRFVRLEAVRGELTFQKANSKAEQEGYFRPTGVMFFSIPDQVVIKGKLKGAGKMYSRSKDHLLFETRSDREPIMELDYSCTVKDSRED